MQFRKTLRSSLTSVVVSHLQVEVHLLFQHGSLAAGDAFVEQQLRLYLSHRTALDGCRVRDDGVQIELVEVYLINDAQRLILLEQFHQ